MATSDLPPLPMGKPLNILLLGKTGHGKSATGNSLLEQEVFVSEPGGKSVTMECEVSGNIVGGRQTAVVDTPGTMDTRDPDAAMQNLAQAITHLDSKIDAVIIVLNYSARMTEEETDCIDKLKRLFGGEILDFVVVIFTHGDNYEKVKKKKKDSRSFSQFIKESGGEYLYEFLGDCGNRYMVIDNLAEEGEAREQVRRIVEIIDAMIEGNLGRRYRSNFWHGVATEEKQKDDELYNDEVVPEDEHIGNKNTSESSTENECVGGGAKQDPLPQTEGDLDRSREETVEEQHYMSAKEEKKHLEQQLLNDWQRTGAHCFPADAVLTVPHVGLVKMEDLEVGDAVLTLSNDLASCETEVYLFGHSFGQCKAIFVCLQTRNKLLKTTGGHFIYTFANGQKSTKVARDVSIGDVLLTMDEGRFVPEEVTDIWQTEETGLYAPFTLSGSILVDGVFVSCYVDVLPPSVAQNLLWPVRQLYKVSPSTLAIISKTGDDGIPRWIKWCLDNFLSV